MGLPAAAGGGRGGGGGAVRDSGGGGPRDGPAAVQCEPGQPRRGAVAAGAEALRARLPARRRRPGHRVSVGRRGDPPRDRGGWRG